jgi:hypothetical protein
LVRKFHPPTSMLKSHPKFSLFLYFLNLVKF